MLGILLIYWIGKYFYKLADLYNKHKWAYGILGVLAYYGGTFFFGFFVGFILEFSSPGYADSVNELFFGFLMIPLGLLCCFLLYKYLEKKWKKEVPNINELLENFGEKEELNISEDA